MTAGKMNVKEKIKDIHFYRAVSDISRPIADSTHTIIQIGFYIVELMTAEGVRARVCAVLPLFSGSNGGSAQGCLQLYQRGRVRCI